MSNKAVVVDKPMRCLIGYFLKMFFFEFFFLN